MHEGRTVRLYCRAAGVPGATITWRKEGGSLPPQVRRPVPVATPPGAPRAAHAPRAAAPLLPSGSPHSPQTLARAIPGQAPLPSVPSWALTLAPGLPSLLTRAGQAPVAEPLAVWQARSERTDIATLLIPAITPADAGFYLCVATSPAGSAQARIQVVVLSGAGPGAEGGAGGGSPRPAYTPLLPASGAGALPVRIESSSPAVTEGQRLDLNCVVAGPAHAEVMWYKRGGSLPPHAQVGGPQLWPGSQGAGAVVGASPGTGGRHLAPPSCRGPTLLPWPRPPAPPLAPGGWLRAEPRRV